MAVSAAAQSDCESNFHAGGTLLKRIYTTSTSYSGIDVKTAVRSLAAALPSREVAVVKVDEEHGVINGRNTTVGQRVFPIDFAATPQGNGVSMQIRVELPTGAFGTADLKPALCALLKLPASTTPSTASGASRPTTPTTTATAGVLQHAPAVETSLADFPGQWLKDKTSGCSAWWTGDQKSAWSARWSGACGPDGKAAGKGKLTLWRDGIFDWEYVVEDNGLAMENGYLKLRIPEGAVYTVGKLPCETEPVVKANLDLSEPWIARAVLRQAAELNKQVCRSYDGVYQLCVKREGKVESGWRGMTGNCDLFMNGGIGSIDEDVIHVQWLPTADRQHLVRKRQEAERGEIQAAKQRKDAEAEAERKQQLVNARRALRVKFGGKYGVTDFVTLETLSQNPFRFQGKNVSVVGTFNVMVAPTIGTVMNTYNGVTVVVNGLSSTAFKGGERIMLAARVLGNVKVNTGSGQIVVPSLAYLGHAQCAEHDCSDQGFARTE